MTEKRYEFPYGGRSISLRELRERGQTCYNRWWSWIEGNPPKTFDQLTNMSKHAWCMCALGLSKEVCNLLHNVPEYDLEQEINKI